MGNSTTSLQDILDTFAVAGDVSPLSSPGSYGPKVAIALANDTLADILSERFNFRWNSALAPSFYTNSYQQDYPGIGLTDVEWLESFQWIDINNTSIPKPISRIGETFVVRQLDRVSLSVTESGRPTHLAWMYNGQMSYGAWPGAQQVYTAPVGTGPTVQNGPTAILDANGNILVLTTFGTTGATAPVLAANASEKATVQDGSCVWTVASPDSKGFRLYPLPGGTGPVFQMQVRYQRTPARLRNVTDLLNPLPDSFVQYFRRGYKAHAAGSSPDPRVTAQFPMLRAQWLQEMEQAARQGDREASAYGLMAASYPMDSPYPGLRNPQDPAQPY